MSDDLISRQAAIEVIDAVLPADPMKSEYAQGIACGAALAKTYVEQLPPTQPKTGHWRKIAKTLYASKVANITANYECSVCGRIVFNMLDGFVYKIYRFCPNCGARMEAAE